MEIDLSSDVVVDSATGPRWVSFDHDGTNRQTTIGDNVMLKLASAKETSDYCEENEGLKKLMEQVQPKSEHLTASPPVESAGVIPPGFQHKYSGSNPLPPPQLPPSTSWCWKRRLESVTNAQQYICTATPATREELDSECHETICHAIASIFRDRTAVTLIHLLHKNVSPTLFGVQDKHGNTPLHNAATAGNAAIARELVVLHPSAVCVRNHERLTPLDIALDHRNDEMVECLLKECVKSAPHKSSVIQLLESYLVKALKNGYTHFLQLVLQLRTEHGLAIDFECTDSSWHTAWHYLKQAAPAVRAVVAELLQESDLQQPLLGRLLKSLSIDTCPQSPLENSRHDTTAHYMPSSRQRLPSTSESESELSDAGYFDTSYKEDQGSVDSPAAPVVEQEVPSGEFAVLQSSDNCHSVMVTGAIQLGEMRRTLNPLVTGKENFVTKIKTDGDNLTTANDTSSQQMSSSGCMLLQAGPLDEDTSQDQRIRRPLQYSHPYIDTVTSSASSDSSLPQKLPVPESRKRQRHKEKQRISLNRPSSPSSSDTTEPSKRRPRRSRESVKAHFMGSSYSECEISPSLSNDEHLTADTAVSDSLPCESTVDERPTLPPAPSPRHRLAQLKSRKQRSEKKSSQKTKLVTMAMFFTASGEFDKKGFKTWVTKTVNKSSSYNHLGLVVHEQLFTVFGFSPMKVSLTAKERRLARAILNFVRSTNHQIPQEVENNLNALKNVLSSRQRETEAAEEVVLSSRPSKTEPAAQRTKTANVKRIDNGRGKNKGTLPPQLLTPVVTQSLEETTPSSPTQAYYEPTNDSVGVVGSAAVEPKDPVPTPLHSQEPHSDVCDPSTRDSTPDKEETVLSDGAGDEKAGDVLGVDVSTVAETEGDKEIQPEFELQSPIQPSATQNVAPEGPQSLPQLDPAAQILPSLTQEEPPGTTEDGGPELEVVDNEVEPPLPAPKPLAVGEPSLELALAEIRRQLKEEQDNAVAKLREELKEQLKGELREGMREEYENIVTEREMKLTAEVVKLKEANSILVAELQELKRHTGFEHSNSESATDISQSSDETTDTTSVEDQRIRRPRRYSHPYTDSLTSSAPSDSSLPQKLPVPASRKKQRHKAEQRISLNRPSTPSISDTRKHTKSDSVKKKKHSMSEIRRRQRHNTQERLSLYRPSTSSSSDTREPSKRRPPRSRESVKKKKHSLSESGKRQKQRFSLYRLSTSSGSDTTEHSKKRQCRHRDSSSDSVKTETNSECETSLFDDHSSASTSKEPPTNPLTSPLYILKSGAGRRRQTLRSKYKNRTKLVTLAKFFTATGRFNKEGFKTWLTAIVGRSSYNHLRTVVHHKLFAVFRFSSLKLRKLSRRERVIGRAVISLVSSKKFPVPPSVKDNLQSLKAVLDAQKKSSVSLPSISEALEPLLHGPRKEKDQEESSVDSDSSANDTLTDTQPWTRPTPEECVGASLLHFANTSHLMHCPVKVCHPPHDTKNTVAIGPPYDTFGGKRKYYYTFTEQHSDPASHSQTDHTEELSAARSREYGDSESHCAMPDITTPGEVEVGTTPFEVEVGTTPFEVEVGTTPFEVATPFEVEVGTTPFEVEVGTTPFEVATPFEVEVGTTPFEVEVGTTPFEVATPFEVEVGTTPFEVEVGTTPFEVATPFEVEVETTPFEVEVGTTPFEVEVETTPFEVATPFEVGLETTPFEVATPFEVEVGTTPFEVEVATTPFEVATPFEVGLETTPFEVATPFEVEVETTPFEVATPFEVEVGTTPFEVGVGTNPFEVASTTPFEVEVGTTTPFEVGLGTTPFEVEVGTTPFEVATPFEVELESNEGARHSESDHVVPDITTPCKLELGHSEGQIFHLVPSQVTQQLDKTTASHCPHLPATSHTHQQSIIIETSSDPAHQGRNGLLGERKTSSKYTTESETSLDLFSSSHSDTAQYTGSEASSSTPASKYPRKRDKKPAKKRRKVAEDRQQFSYFESDCVAPRPKRFKRHKRVETQEKSSSSTTTHSQDEPLWSKTLCASGNPLSCGGVNKQNSKDVEVSSSDSSEPCTVRPQAESAGGLTKIVVYIDIESNRINLNRIIQMCLMEKYYFQVVPRQLKVGDPEQPHCISLSECSGEHACVVGNPTLPPFVIKGNRLRNLPGAAAEVAFLSHLFQCHPLTLKEASKEAVMNKLERARFAHLATHECKGLVLSDAVLTSSDIEQLVFENGPPVLVVLNCCGTADTVCERKGLENISLALLKVKVLAVVAVFGSVGDTLALRFAKLFYHYMIEVGLPATHALYNAQHEVYQQESTHQYIYLGKDLKFIE